MEFLLKARSPAIIMSKEIPLLQVDEYYRLYSHVRDSEAMHINVARWQNNHEKSDTCVKNARFFLIKNHHVFVPSRSEDYPIQIDVYSKVHDHNPFCPSGFPPLKGVVYILAVFF